MLNVGGLIKRRPIEVGASVVLVGLAAALSWAAAELDAPVSTVFTISAIVASVLGGTLASYTASTFNTGEIAAEILRPQLSQANMNLAHVTYQVGRLIADFADGHIDAPTAIRFTQRAYDSLRSSITIYEQITGQNVEVDRVKQTLQSMELMKKMFSEEGDSEELRTLLQAKIAEVRSEIAAFKSTSAAVLAERLTEREEVEKECYHCGATTTVLLGMTRGDTAHAHCRQGHTFIVHRTGAGDVIYGGEADPVHLTPERILRRQKVPLIAPALLDAGLAAMTAAFSQQAKHTFPTRSALEAALARRLSEHDGFVPDRDAKDLWLLGYKTKIFHFIPDEGGIQLREDFTPEALTKEVRTRLVERILSEAEAPIDSRAIVQVLAADEQGEAQVREALKFLGPSFGH